MLDGQPSSVSLFVNDLGVGGQILRGGYGLPATIVFPLTASALLSRGFNYMQLRIALRDCQNHPCANDPALQVTVSGTSLLRYDVPGDGALDLSRLPAPFLAPDVTAPLGAERPAAPPLLTTHPGTGSGLGANSDAILVGTAQDNPAIAMLATPAGLHLASGTWQDSDIRALPPMKG